MKFSMFKFRIFFMFFLGHVVFEKLLMIDPLKVDVVLNWARLTFLNVVHSFVGFSRYY